MSGSKLVTLKAWLMKVRTHREGKDFSAEREAKCKCPAKDDIIVYIGGKAFKM